MFGSTVGSIHDFAGTDQLRTGVFEHVFFCAKHGPHVYAPKSMGQFFLPDSLILISFFLSFSFRMFHGWVSKHSDVLEEAGMAASEPSGENLGRSYVIGSSSQPCMLVLAVGQEGTEYDLPVHEVTEYSGEAVWWELLGQREEMVNLCRALGLDLVRCPVAC